MRGRPRRLSVAVAVLGLAVVTAIVLVPRPSDPRRMLEIEMRASAGTMAQLYWAPDREFAESRSIRIPFRPTSEGFQRLRFPLPSRGVEWIRIDPTDAPGEVLIGEVRVLDSRGQIQGTLNPDDFNPSSGIASITRLGDMTRVVTAPQAGDPFLIAPFACMDGSAGFQELSLVTPTALALVSGAVSVLLLACTALVGRAVFGAAPSATRWLAALWLTVLFLVVFSAKLLLMSQNPVTVPYWDQWDAEARSLYIPFNECSLSWPQMFALHNEHRVFFTRLLALDLLVVNGQWDPRLQQVVNAAMHAFTGALTAAILWLTNGRRRLALLAFICGVTFAMPFAWDNTLMGFQSAFYFLLLFSVLALWLTTRYRAGSAPWFLGWACATSALFTSAGGVITTVAILGVAVLHLANDPRRWREFLITLPCAAAVLGLGTKLASAPLPPHEVFRAHTAAEFSGALANNLAWPWIENPELAILMWLPACLLLLEVAQRRGKTKEFERLIVGLGGWVVLNAAAIAYGRGAGAALPATRYMDFLSLGFVVNAMALLAMLDLAGTRTLVRRVALGGLAGWLVFAIVGVERLTGRTLVELKASRGFFAAHQINVRRFVATGDVAEIASKRGPAEIPYPDPYRLASALQDPHIRRILPAAVRPPLHVEPRVATSKGFVTDGPFAGRIPRDPLQRYWWSLAGEGKSGQGRFDSEHLVCQVGGRLKFQVSGYLGWEHNSLVVRDLRTGGDLAVTPARVAKEDWTDVVVSCPPALFQIVAVDGTPDSWFGFREPVEIGWGSLAAESLIGRSRTLMPVARMLSALAVARI